MCFSIAFDESQASHFGVAQILDPNLATLDHRNVGRGSPDINGDDVVLTAMFAGPPSSNHASGRARQQQADRPLRGVLHRRDAAVGLHDTNHRLHAVGAEPGL